MVSEMNEGPMGGVANDAYERIQHGQARAVNMEAGQALAEAVRTTLGPRGLDKMLVDSLAGVKITNDGATIIRELDFDNPAAKMVAEVAKTQDDDVGDGTTTGVVLAGTLLGEAGALFEQGMHPQTIVRGYRRASRRAREYYRNNAFEVNPGDTEALESIVRTTMTGKAADQRSAEFADLLIEAIQHVERDGQIDVDGLRIETVVGGSAGESEVVRGTLMEQVPAHPSMPESFEDATVALLDSGLETELLDYDGELTVSDAADARGFAEGEMARALELAELFADAGVDLLLVAEDIDTEIVEHLAQHGVLAADQTPEEAIERTARATGADIVQKVDAFGAENTGTAGRVEVADIDWETHFFVEECPGDMVTILVRGGTLHVQEELKRNLEDAVSTAVLAIEERQLCPGGGTLETGAARAVREYSSSVGDREQLAVEAFADALEAIPRTLAETAGMDPVDTMVELRRQFAEGETVGLDVHSKSIEDMADRGVIEPLDVKLRALETAVEATTMLLRIDDILESEELPDERDEMMNDMPR